MIIIQLQYATSYPETTSAIVLSLFLTSTCAKMTLLYEERKGIIYLSKIILSYNFN